MSPPRMTPPAKERMVVRAYRTGANLRQAGQRGGVSHETARRILLDHGVPLRLKGYYGRPSRKFTARQQARMRSMYAARYSCVQIGLRVGASGAVVSSELRGQGVRIRPAGRPQIGINEQRRIAQLYRAGHTIAELRDLFHRNSKTIKCVMTRQGVVSRPAGQQRPPEMRAKAALRLKSRRVTVQPGRQGGRG